jgi:hypothetical protein
VPGGDAIGGGIAGDVAVANGGDRSPEIVLILASNTVVGTHAALRRAKLAGASCGRSPEACLCALGDAAADSFNADAELRSHSRTATPCARTSRDYMLALPDHRELRKSWHAAKLILEQADIGAVSRQLAP